MLELDHTTVLTLLLRYPHPKPPHLPATFVSDAIYLRDHLDVSGGAFIISKYSNRTPVPASLLLPPQSPFSSPSQRARKAGSLRSQSIPSLSKPTAKLSQVQEGLDKFVNDLAKGVVDTGKVWHLNKAILKVMGEINRKVEGSQSTDTPPLGGCSDSVQVSQGKTTTAMQERNNMLVLALEQIFVELEPMLWDRPEFIPTMRRIRLVQSCLRDDTIEIDPANLFGDQSSPAPRSNMNAGLPLHMAHPQFPKPDFPIVPHGEIVPTTPTQLQVSFPPLPHSPHTQSPIVSRISTSQSTFNPTVLPDLRHRLPSSAPSHPCSQLGNNLNASLTASPTDPALTYERNSFLEATSINYRAEQTSKIARNQRVRPSVVQSAFAWMLGEPSLSSGEGEYHRRESPPASESGNKDQNDLLFGAEVSGSSSGSLDKNRVEKRVILFEEQ